MKQEFLGYYSPSEEDFEKLWSECTFVFDANMLINLYRFPRDSREALVTIMESVQERIWIPHQVALEYHKLLHDEIYNQKNAYSKFEEQCTNSINDLVAELVSLRHSNIESKGIEKVLKDCLKKINDELKKQAASQPDLVAIQDKVTQLIGDKVGKPYTKDQLNKLYEEGEARYNDKIPPGYKDLNDKKGKTTLYGESLIKMSMGILYIGNKSLRKSRKM
ncbi:PIN-like domain-containing protein [Paenibacillus sp. DCT19]|uniref:PIN-like domain-containing protein n=1 Tax=Paenibacillus sp. DCT19 TaxID=2211212 RepID=UPI000FE19646|nr:PIN-like domain-containing protein [Paenibacillus sp. DCT19]